MKKTLLTAIITFSFLAITFSGCGQVPFDNNKCFPGGSRPCTCDNGATGNEYCTDGQWEDRCRDCPTQPPKEECSSGSSRLCKCDSGIDGKEYCINGKWDSKCQGCLVKPPKEECTSGSSKSCTCEYGRVGKLYCTNGKWESSCQDCGCRPGATQTCRCNSAGEMGKRKCDSYGRWGGCESCAMPCAQNGTTPKYGQRCCSNEKNDKGKCCSGKSCCGSQNHSYTSQTGECLCRSGYTWVNHDAEGDFRCKPTPKADLRSVAFKLQYYAPKDKQGFVAFCLNRNLEGDKRDNGNYIKVYNGGEKSAQEYKLGIGIQDRNGKYWFCKKTLTTTSTHQAKSSKTWRGPWCCGFSVKTLSSGKYRIFVKADRYNQVSESSESNNVTFGGSIDIP